MGFEQNSIVTAIMHVESFLRSEFIARDELIHSLMVGTIIGEHTLIIGPHGTAKSKIVKSLCKCIHGGQHFEYQLTPRTALSELMGALSIEKLGQDKHVRKTEGMLPTSHVVFLDEVFRGSSPILNVLLSIMNERVYYNDGVQRSPLLTLIGTSNTLPTGEDPLLDRFLFRHHTRRLYPFELYRLLLTSGHETRVRKPKIRLEELVWLYQTIPSVRIPDSIRLSLSRLTSHWNRKGADISGRRAHKTLNALAGTALLAGRLVVNKSDASILTNIYCKNREDNKTFLPLLEYYFQCDEISDMKYVVAAEEEYTMSIKYMEECKLSENNKESLETLSSCLNVLNEIHNSVATQEARSRINELLGSVEEHVMDYGL